MPKFPHAAGLSLTRWKPKKKTLAKYYVQEGGFVFLFQRVPNTRGRITRDAPWIIVEMSEQGSSLIGAYADAPFLDLSDAREFFMREIRPRLRSES